MSREDYSKRCAEQRAEREELILMALRESGPMTVKDLAAILGIRATQAYVSIYALEAAGRTARTECFPANCYVVERNEDAPAVVAPSMSERVSNWPNTATTKRVGNEVLVSCTGCTESRKFGGRMPAAQVRINCEREGWTIDKKWKRVLCTACVAKEKQMTKSNTAATQRPSLRVVIGLLEEYYDPSASAYDADWTDERIAKDADCSVSYVADIREREFGPLEDPRIADLRAAITRARAGMKADADEIRTLAADAERKWTETLDDLGRRLAAVLKPK